MVGLPALRSWLTKLETRAVYSAVHSGVSAFVPPID
jgi:hypothetical protein